MEQTRISFQAEKNDAYMNYTIWQPEIGQPISLIPWAVHIEGWIRQGIDITIYHETIKNGKITFSNCKFASPKKFADFVAKMLMLQRDVFKRNLKISGNDCLALMDGYRKGFERARQLYIECP